MSAMKPVLADQPFRAKNLAAILRRALRPDRAILAAEINNQPAHARFLAFHQSERARRARLRHIRRKPLQLELIAFDPR